MGTVPTPVGDEFDDDHPIISAAVDALTHFGGDLTRDQAGRLPDMWTHRHELSGRERAAILARFPDAADGGWISGGMAGQ